MRQVLELRGAAPGAGAQWQTDLRQAFYRRLLPQIEQACAQLGTPGGVDRIERLEIDLGTVSPDRFEADLGRRLGAVLARKLADAIESAPRTDTDLELFAQFIGSGTLPWWADGADRGLLEANLQRLVEHRPQALRQHLLSRPDLGLVWRRLALTYSDPLLGRLAWLLAPAGRDGGAGVLSAWLAMLGPVALVRGSAGRKVWWEETLRAFGAAASAGAQAPGMWRAILARVARRLGSDEPALRAEVRRTLDAASDRGAALAFWHEFSAEPAAAPVAPREPLSGVDGHARLVHALRLLGAGNAPGAALWARLREVLGRLPAPLRAQAVAALDAQALAAMGGLGAAGGPTRPGSAALQALAGLVQAARDQGLVAPALIEPVADWLGGVDSPRQEPARAPARTEVSAFGSNDELHVHNAGLVVLWPFLTTFFERLGLTENACFKDEAATQRAVGLLQVLAAADPSPPETLLPLNKVLCGMAPEAVFDIGPPLTPTEVAECDALLAAVIAQVPILGAMSVAGFRGSFLLRPGQLGGRDGHWLLRVERMTHDIVLDRFPWGVQFVKLPWMETVMQVEW